MASLRLAKQRLKYAVIRAGLEAIALSPLERLFPSIGGRGLIFTLHHVHPETKGQAFEPNAILSVTPAFLKEAIQAALEHNLTPVHLHDLPALLADPADTRNFVAFTLDDGYRNNAEFAAPVFREFDIPYTIFITSGFVERTRSMWWETAAAIIRESASIEFDFGYGLETVISATLDQKLATFERFASFVGSIDEDEAVQRIDETAMHRHGINPLTIVDALVMNEAELRSLSKDSLAHFGAHTVTHVNLCRVDPNRLQREIADSTSAVERYVGQRPQSFSYPYGWSRATGKREANAARRAGFGLAVTTQPGVLGSYSLEQPMLLPRVSLNGYFQKKRYVKALISGLPFRFM